MTDASFATHLDADRTLVVTFSGDWMLGNTVPDMSALLDEIRTAKNVRFAAGDLGKWDSAFIAALARLERGSLHDRDGVDRTGLPDGAQRLLRLAFAVPEREGARRETVPTSFADRLGARLIKRVVRFREVTAFLGEIVLSLGRLMRGKATFQRADLWVNLQETGVEALGIVSLIAFLIGVILGFVGVIQLEAFGAGIYVANLVAIGMVREMGPIMTAILMAGRTGAAFAAQLGTMKVNEEIDALSTMGVNPVDFLVLPRLLALTLMMPLLALYSDLLGMLGGATVALGMLNVSVSQYYVQTIDAIDFADFAGGLVKASLYGVLVALAGCMRGMECGNSAAAVGLATTSSVVTSIVLIVVSCGIMTVIYTNLGV